jgi:hypothetical protein
MQQIVARHTATDEPGASGIALWTLAGFALYVLGGAVSIFLTAIVVDPLLEASDMPVEAGSIGLSLRNALQPIVWGCLVALPALPIGRRLIPGVRFRFGGWVLLATGLALAAVTWFLQEEFVRARYARFDPEYVGFSLFAWLALVAIALCGWASLAVRRGSGAPIAVLLALAVTGMGVALLPSVPGVADGMGPGHLPLGLMFFVDVAYAIAVVAIVFRRIASHRDA